MKKKLFLLLLSLCLILLAAGCSKPLSASDLERTGSTMHVGDYDCEMLRNKSLMITGYSGDAEELTLPEKLGGKNVMALDEGVFRYSNLKSVTIPKNIRYCAGNPFAGAPLQTVSVASDHSVFEVVDNVLFSKNDKKLICYPAAAAETSYTVPSGTKIIGVAAFEGNKTLQEIELPDSVNQIDSKAFARTAFSSIVIPHGVKKLDYAVFENSRIEQIAIPDTVESISFSAFYRCSALKRIQIPESVTSIGETAFFGCDLEDVVIPKSVMSIGDKAFYGDGTTLIVYRDSVAEQYCREWNLKYTCADE